MDRPIMDAPPCTERASVAGNDGDLGDAVTVMLPCTFRCTPLIHGGPTEKPMSTGPTPGSGHAPSERGSQIF